MSHFRLGPQPTLESRTDVSTWAFSLTESLFHDLECTPFPGMLYVALTSSARECYGPGRSFEPGRNNQQLRGFKC